MQCCCRTGTKQAEIYNLLSENLFFIHQLQHLLVSFKPCYSCAVQSEEEFSGSTPSSSCASWSGYNSPRHLQLFITFLQQISPSAGAAPVWLPMFDANWSSRNALLEVFFFFFLKQPGWLWLWQVGEQAHRQLGAASASQIWMRWWQPPAESVAEAGLSSDHSQGCSFQTERIK